jgi:hypothetical protein
VSFASNTRPKRAETKSNSQSAQVCALCGEGLKQLGERVGGGSAPNATGGATSGAAGTPPAYDAPIALFVSFSFDFCLPVVLRSVRWPCRTKIASKN